MLPQRIIRAWKDVDYRLSLSEAERARLPEHPAGLVEMTEKELSPVGAGNLFTSGCPVQSVVVICTLGCVRQFVTLFQTVCFGNPVP
jgi:mersacidin/lichenicidin family type 2 lantibiotic